MIVPKTPGVYIREIEVSPPTQLRMDTVGFVGQAERGPLNYPQLITNWGQFRDIFGGFVGYSYLSHAVFGFFLNGGQRCYAVRVADEIATKASFDFVDEDNIPTMRVEAINEGEWGNAVDITIERESSEPPDSDQKFKLIIRYRRDAKLAREEVFENLSISETDDRYFLTIINGDPEEQDYVKRIKDGNSILVRAEVLGSGPPSRPAPVNARALENGSNGRLTFDRRYYTGYEDGAYFRPRPSDVSEAKLNGLAAFETEDEMGLIAIPDLIIPDLSEYYSGHPDVQIPEEGMIFGEVPSDELGLENLRLGQLDMLEHCEKMGDRFAILDSPPGSQTGTGVNRIENWPGHLQLSPNAKYGAMYYPWIKQRASDSDGRELFIPPSGHVAGIYARSEQQRGIGKAPANEILRGVIELEFHLSDAEQDILNPRGVNCLRALPGRGLRVWGARTLSSELLWRYVNVRRVCLWIIKNILVNLQWTVFEPNDQRLWDRITTTLTLFFKDLLRQGALAGATPEEAFFIKCNEETNTSEVMDRGWVITEIGFAPAYPAEFVMVTVKRTAESISVSEQ